MIEAVCTWGDGPNVLLTCDDKQYDLTASQAEKLIVQLQMAVSTSRRLDELCLQHDLADK